MILYVENPEDATKMKTCESQSTSPKKFQDTKSVHKILLCFYTLRMNYQKEKFFSMSFTFASKSIKHLQIDLTKDMKYLYNENYKTLMKDIKEETNKWKYIPCPWIKKINIVRMFILLKEIYRFNEIPIKILMVFFMEVKQY